MNSAMKIRLAQLTNVSYERAEDYHYTGDSYELRLGRDEAQSAVIWDSEEGLRLFRPFQEETLGKGFPSFAFLFRPGLLGWMRSPYMGSVDSSWKESAARFGDVAYAVSRPSARRLIGYGAIRLFPSRPSKIDEDVPSAAHAHPLGFFAEVPSLGVTF